MSANALTSIVAMDRSFSNINCIITISILVVVTGKYCGMVEDNEANGMITFYRDESRSLLLGYQRKLAIDTLCR